MVPWPKLLTALLPGLGYIYNGQVAIGLVLSLTFLSLAAAIVLVEEFGLPLVMPLGLVWAINLYDALGRDRAAALPEPLVVHYLDSAVRARIIEYFRAYPFPLQRPLKIWCIGSEAFPGDSFGPLVGAYLTKFGHGNVLGTSEQPLDAAKLAAGRLEEGEDFIIAVDAGIAPVPEQEGMFVIRPGGLAPGGALGQHLPTVGQLSVVFYACHNKTPVHPLLLFCDPTLRERSAYAAQLAAHCLDRFLRGPDCEV